MSENQGTQRICVQTPPDTENAETSVLIFIVVLCIFILSSLLLCPTDAQLDCSKSIS